MNEEVGTLGNKEAYAYAHPNYIEVLEDLKQATEEEELLKFLMIADQLNVDVWKTQEYTKRQEMKNL